MDITAANSWSYSPSQVQHEVSEETCLLNEGPGAAKGMQALLIIFQC